MSVQQQLQRALFENVRLRYFQAATPACAVCAPRKHQAKSRSQIDANVLAFRNSMLPLCRHSKRSQPPTQPSADSATNQRCVFHGTANSCARCSRSGKCDGYQVRKKLNSCRQTPEFQGRAPMAGQKALVSSPPRARIYGHAPENMQIRASGSYHAAHSHLTSHRSSLARHRGPRCATLSPIFRKTPQEQPSLSFQLFPFVTMFASSCLFALN